MTNNSGMLVCFGKPVVVSRERSSETTILLGETDMSDNTEEAVAVMFKSTELFSASRTDTRMGPPTKENAIFTVSLSMLAVPTCVLDVLTVR